MLSRSLSNCQSLTLNVMTRVYQFARRVNCGTKSLTCSQCFCLCHLFWIVLSCTKQLEMKVFFVFEANKQKNENKFSLQSWRVWGRKLRWLWWKTNVYIESYLAVWPLLRLNRALSYSHTFFACALSQWRWWWCWWRRWWWWWWQSMWT